jgi:hypothetical protein
MTAEELREIADRVQAAREAEEMALASVALDRAHEQMRQAAEKGEKFCHFDLFLGVGEPGPNDAKLLRGFQAGLELSRFSWIGLGLTTVSESRSYKTYARYRISWDDAEESKEN